MSIADITVILRYRSLLRELRNQSMHYIKNKEVRE